MLTRSDIRAIDQIVEKAIRMGLATKHHRYSLTEALRKLKEGNPEADLESLLYSPSFADTILKLRSQP